MPDSKIHAKRVNDKITYLTDMADLLLSKRSTPGAKSFSSEFLIKVKDVLEKNDIDISRELD